MCRVQRLLVHSGPYLSPSSTFRPSPYLTGVCVCVHMCLYEGMMALMYHNTHVPKCMLNLTIGIYVQYVLK